MFSITSFEHKFEYRIKINSITIYCGDRNTVRGDKCLKRKDYSNIIQIIILIIFNSSSENQKFFLHKFNIAYILHWAVLIQNPSQSLFKLCQHLHMCVLLHPSSHSQQPTPLLHPNSQITFSFKNLTSIHFLL